MNKYFSLLGLREDAGKDDVKAAYARRVQKYKASDYDDDPEYVRKKLAELKIAYENAYRMAGNGRSDYRRDDFDLPAASPGTSSRSEGAQQQAHRRFHDQEEKAARQRRIKKIQENESRKDKIEAEEDGSLFRRPDLSALRQKAEALHNELKTHADQLKETVSNALDGEEDNDAAPPAIPRLTPTAANASHGTGGTVIKTPPGVNGASDFHDAGKKDGNKANADKTEIDRSDSGAKNSDSNIGTIISVIGFIIALICSMGQCGGDDYDYDDYDDTATYNYYYQTEEEAAVFDTAIASSDLLFEAGYSDSWTAAAYDDASLQAEADQFAKNYLDMVHLSEVCSYLYDNYGDFYVAGDDPLNTQISEVLAFYGFMRPDDALGYIDPYREETITNAYEYLLYLNEYFEQNDLATDL